jgi:hypothetical protein
VRQPLGAAGARPPEFRAAGDPIPLGTLLAPTANPDRPAPAVVSQGTDTLRRLGCRSRHRRLKSLSEKVLFE